MEIRKKTNYFGLSDKSKFRPLCPASWRIRIISNIIGVLQILKRVQDDEPANYSQPAKEMSSIIDFFPDFTELNSGAFNIHISTRRSGFQIRPGICRHAGLHRSG